uniref:Uncharacterized protein n=1 Tax=viral metagenome TaxID=1070528 RepID=A0A6C0B3S0_9ZZZZ
MGWIVLSYDNNVPVCSWITARECCVLKVCLDERLFGDTIFRAEKVRDTYVISDVFVYNSSCIFNTSTFQQRYEWTKELLTRFYRPGLAVFIHKSNLPENISLRGWELYDWKEGSHGCFIEEQFEIVTKTDIPDVYTVVGKQGYVLVPNLKTSQYLRSKGSEFKLKCVEKDGNWEVILPN